MNTQRTLSNTHNTQEHTIGKIGATPPGKQHTGTNNGRIAAIAHSHKEKTQNIQQKQEWQHKRETQGHTHNKSTIALKPFFKGKSTTRIRAHTHKNTTRTTVAKQEGNTRAYTQNNNTQ